MQDSESDFVALVIEDIEIPLAAQGAALSVCPLVTHGGLGYCLATAGSSKRRFAGRDSGIGKASDSSIASTAPGMGV